MITHTELVRARQELLERANAFERSYVGLNAADIDDAVVVLGHTLAEQIPDLHRTFALGRPLTSDLSAVDLVIRRQVA